MAGQALRNYELLSQNTLSSIPSGSSLFAAPEELREIPEIPLDSPRPSLLDRLLRRPKVQRVQYCVRNYGSQVKAAGGDYILKESLQYRELDEARRKACEQKLAFTERFSMALFGGVSLMAPVLIMSLHPGRTIALITCSIAVVLFAFTLAFFAPLFARSTSGKDILAATAAYAAVPVVFIGTSSGPTNE